MSGFGTSRTWLAAVGAVEGPIIEEGRVMKAPKIRMHDKLKALDMLAKMVRLYPAERRGTNNEAPRVPRLLLGRQPNGVLDLDRLSDQATGPLDEGEFVGETALQKQSDAKVSGYVSHRNQRHVLGDA